MDVVEVEVPSTVPGEPTALGHRPIEARPNEGSPALETAKCRMESTIVWGQSAHSRVRE